MRRHQNSVLAVCTAKTGISHTIRRHLTATTILVAAPFLGYGRQAFAACDTSGAPTVVCDDTITGFSFTFDNLNVSTDGDPPFQVTTNGVIIDGNGHIQFTDNNGSIITSTTGNGLEVRSHGDDPNTDPDTPGAVTIITDGNITGSNNGIFAGNEGSGSIAITADGQVTGEGNLGIYGRNGSAGNNLTIETGAESVVTGITTGMVARNYGRGYLHITANGEVTGENNGGIYAFNSGNGTDLIITTGEGSVITGGHGIGAVNRGHGNLEITANGQVYGVFGGDGINAFNAGYVSAEEPGGINLTIETGPQSLVRGDLNGIRAVNEGSGYLAITVDGQMTGAGRDGVYATNSQDSTDLIITSGAASIIRGENGEGIEAHNHGAGDTTITVNGEATGGGGDGIHVRNISPYSGGDANYQVGSAENVTVITGPESVITGAHDGIEVRNFGSGYLKINAGGQVTGRDINDTDDSDGIRALNSSNGTYLQITTGPGSVITGNDNGIRADNNGSGELAITVNGVATGLVSDGVYARIDSSADVDAVIKIGADGLTQGAGVGINAVTNGKDILITNEGGVQNLSGDSFAWAIQTRGGPSDIVNSGSIVGFVTLGADGGAFDDTFDNSSLWNTAGGASDFGDGSDELTNSGTLTAANGGGDNEVTVLNRLETFRNSGLVSLADGREGDELQLNDGGNFVGEGGTLAIDALLGPTGQGAADRFIVDGNTSGTTTIAVNVLGATGANEEGIAVVEVNGTSAEGHFELDGPLNVGFFTWELRFDEENNWHELFSTGVGAGAYELAAGVTGAQEIWHQTTGTLLQRQADLRALLEGVSVTPVADYAEPVEPTPTAMVTPGFWFKGVGAYVERQDEEDGFSLDREQTIWGGMAGFDFGHQGAGSAWLFGIFAGYLTSDLDFEETNTKWTYEGPTVGGYVTYLDHGFYADLTVKADFLDIGIETEGLEDDADTDATNVGGRIDTGYKFGDTLFIEPQATLAVVHTEIDDVDILGSTVVFDDETSVRGRLGLRLGFDQPGSDGTVYSGDVTASVWEDFSGDNDVTIAGFATSDDPGGTYGDVSLGFSVAAPEGWSGFVRGNYLFGDDYEAVTGNAGVRYAW